MVQFPVVVPKDLGGRDPSPKDLTAGNCVEDLVRECVGVGVLDMMSRNLIRLQHYTTMVRRRTCPQSDSDGRIVVLG